MFKYLSEKPIAEVQKAQAKKWEDENLLKRSVDQRDGCPSFIFTEGPPTANGRPGIHHVMARTLKDSVCKYKAMKGYRVERKGGWDTHGLPVEIEVEKQLGMSCKQDIEEYGIEKFNQKCRESVFTYESMWREMTNRMGYLIDMDNPYITLDNNYIESCWWIMSEFFKAGLVYEGHKILPYCPRCGTGLASHEVAQGYKEVKVLTLIAQFKRKDADEYFLAWTTTPWTLAANVSLTVAPDADYYKVRMTEGEFGGRVYYIEKVLADKVLGEGNYEVLEEMKGKELEYIEYEQLMPFCDVDKKAFFVTCADYVTMEDGTGIVHTAPAFGEDDYNTGLQYDLPVLNPVNEDGEYIDTPWKGHFVMEEGLDVEILKWLASEGKIFSKENMEHNYPHCWRCSTPLVYYAKPSWYIGMSKLKDDLVANNNTVNWYPDFVGEKRFGNWLAEVKDWAISRNRYWGTPLPIWICEECGHQHCVSSRADLVERAIEDIDESIELHRPYVDDVHLKCEKCGSKMTRTEEVLDCWFDSGAAPIAQHHYPFENADRFDEELFPADFICEGIDQTRGWFYSLMAISTFIKKKSPYKNVLVNDLILDKDGKKMSKSRGNTIDPFDLFDEYGADATRWYLLQVSPVWTPTRFDKDGLQEVASKFFGTLRNVYHFFVLYANQEDVDVSSLNVPYAEKPELDRWIISKYNRLIKEVTEEMDRYDHMKSVRKIQEFVIEDLSNWYIRRARRRFWGDMNKDKEAVYSTTYEILVGIAELIAPFAPFISDEIYINLTGEYSVHTADFPVANEDYIDNKVEERMDLVRVLVGLGRGVREKEGIKVRQPLRGVMVDGKYEDLISDLAPLMKEELNIKEVVFAENLDDYMNYALKPNFKVAGPILGKNIKAFAGALAKADVAPFVAGETVKMTLNDEEFDITPDLVDVKIHAKKGFAVAMENNIFAILDTNLTPELVSEGLAREVVSKVQQLRKQKQLEMMDRITLYLDMDEEVAKAVSEHEDYIMGETLSLELITDSDEDLQEFDINGHKTGIDLCKR